MQSTSGKCDGESKAHLTAPFLFLFFFFLSQLGAKWLSEAAMEGAMSPVGGETEPEL